jgi:hypothetical protein
MLRDATVRDAWLRLLQRADRRSEVAIAWQRPRVDAMETDGRASLQTETWGLRGARIRQTQ